jgi:hypothetical protein
MVGLPFLFDTFGTLLENLLQKEVDMHELQQDKDALDMSMLGSSCEVDPMAIGQGGEGVDAAGMLSLNVL